MLISREEMAQHISTGRAELWTQELGADRDLLNVVRMDDTWYVILVGSDDYQPAPEPMATALVDWKNSLAIAAEKTAAAAADSPRDDRARPS